MLNLNANAAFGGPCLVSRTLAAMVPGKEMHASARRLYHAAQELAGVTGQSAVARLLGQSPQTLKNWEVRGVSKEGALATEARIGARAVWVMDGEAPMTSQANRHLTAGPRDPAMAHDLSRFQPEDAPHIDWGAIMEATKLAQIFWTTLPDDSMAPRAPEPAPVARADLPSKPAECGLFHDCG